MKKKLFFTGALVSAIALILYSIILGYGLIVIAASGIEIGYNTVMFAICELGIAISTIVFDFRLLRYTKSGQGLMSQKKMASAALYETLIFACFLIVDIFSATDIFTISIMAVMIVALTVATVLMAIDYYKELKIENNANSQTVQGQTEAKQDVQVNENSIENRLQKIQDLKDQKLITEEEAEKRRKEILEEMDK